MNLLEILFGNNSKSKDKSKDKFEIDLSQQVFYSGQFRQSGYDREIDEGMSSGLCRYITLDVTLLPELDLKNAIDEVVSKAQNFSVCKLVQVAGFTLEGKKYLAISGESHDLYSGAAKSSMFETLKPIMEKFPIEFIPEYVPMPVSDPYKTTNLGPYGSTGCPAAGIPQHPNAQKLRDEGLIR